MSAPLSAAKLAEIQKRCDTTSGTSLHDQPTISLLAALRAANRDIERLIEEIERLNAR